MQNFLIASAFFYFLIPNISHANIEGCDPIWAIENLAVDEINENPSEARITAENKIIIDAFKLLLDRIVVKRNKSKEIKLPIIDSKVLKNMLDFKLVKSETTLSNRYIAEFSFCFLSQPVTEFLISNNFSWSELKSRPILILPVWKTEFGSRLWKDPNPLRYSYQKSLLMHFGLSNQILPIGRIGVERSIDSNLAIKQNENAISRAIDRSGASRALLIIADITENLNTKIINERKKTINVEAILFGKTGVSQGVLYKKILLVDNSNINKSLDILTKEIIFSMEARWKQANRFEGKSKTKIEIFILANNAFSWSKGLKKIKNLPGVESVFTKSLVFNGGLVEVSVRGNIKKFISMMLENNFPLSGSKEKLILKAEKFIN